jgi:hypothetical protein
MNEINTDRVEKILEEMAIILFAEKSSSPWGRKLQSLARKKTMHSDDFRSQVKSLYGGMGSLNDIVLFGADGKVDKLANQKFTELKAELYQIVSSRSN